MVHRSLLGCVERQRFLQKVPRSLGCGKWDLSGFRLASPLTPPVPTTPHGLRWTVRGVPAAALCRAPRVPSGFCHPCLFCSILVWVWRFGFAFGPLCWH